ncbi:MAG: Type IV fimbrial assembly, ATPase PilB, partial [uncultured Solirubrobacteraceae bacterium]
APLSPHHTRRHRPVGRHHASHAAWRPQPLAHRRPGGASLRRSRPDGVGGRRRPRRREDRCGDATGREAHHAGPARACNRRAPRPRPPRPEPLPGRHGRHEPPRPRSRQALRGRPGRLHRRAHRARRDGRPRQRPGDRRHRDHDGPRGPCRGRLPRGHRRRHQPHRAPRRRGRHDQPRRGVRGRERARRGRRPARVRRRRAGHQARQPDHRPGGRAGHLGHPLRARGQPASRPLPHRRRAHRDDDDPQADGLRRRQPREDHVRPRHRRASRAAGRPRQPDDRRSPDRPARRDAPERPRRVDRHAHPRQVVGHHGARPARDGRGRPRALLEGLPPGVRRGARHGPDRLGQVDVALRGARRHQHAREEHHHDRGPGRVPGRRDHAGPDEPEGRPDVRQRPARDDARRSGRDHGRRDPRPRDGPDRHRGRAHRPPRPLDAAHQRRPRRRDAPHRDGHRVLPRLQRDRLRRGPAPRADAVRALQEARDAERRGPARRRLHGDRARRRLRPGRLLALRRLRLQGPPRAVRGHEHHRRDPHAGRRACRRRQDRRGRRAPGHAPPARGRPGQGQAGEDLDRRGHPRDRLAL